MTAYIWTKLNTTLSSVPLIWESSKRFLTSCWTNQLLRDSCDRRQPFSTTSWIHPTNSWVSTLTSDRLATRRPSIRCALSWTPMTIHQFNNHWFESWWANTSPFSRQQYDSVWPNWSRWRAGYRQWAAATKAAKSRGCSSPIVNLDRCCYVWSNSWFARAQMENAVGIQSGKPVKPPFTHPMEVGATISAKNGLQLYDLTTYIGLKGSSSSTNFSKK